MGKLYIEIDNPEIKQVSWSLDWLCFDVVTLLQDSWNFYPFGAFSTSCTRLENNPLIFTWSQSLSESDRLQPTFDPKAKWLKSTPHESLPFCPDVEFT